MQSLRASLTTGPLVVLTIGHSNRPIDQFLDLLGANGVQHVLDVRTVPKSLHNPQFGQEALAQFLETVDIAYSHLPALGGLRRARKDSPNDVWRNKSFQGYADYMQTPEFAEGVEHAIELAWASRCVLMCAEAVPWRCHRSLIADALTVRHIRVEDIIGTKGRRPHTMTPWAQVRGMTITYPKT